MLPFAPPVADVIALVAAWFLLGPLLLVIYAVVRRRAWRVDGIEGAIGGVATIAIVKISGALYFHVRPFVALHMTPLVAHAPDNGFPSDHLAACGLAFGFLWTRSRTFAILVLVFAAALGAARVLARLHWPLDIAAGFAEGILGSIIGRFLIEGRNIRPSAGIPG